MLGIKSREPLLGRVDSGVVRENTYGGIVRAAWEDLSNHHDNVVLDEFVIVPNHIQVMIIINHVVPGSELATTAR